MQKEKEKSGNGKGKGKGSKGKAKKDQKAKDNSDEITVLDDTASETSENPGGVKFKKPDAPKKLIYYHIMTLENVLDLLRKLQKYVFSLILFTIQLMSFHHLHYCVMFFG